MTANGVSVVRETKNSPSSLTARSMPSSMRAKEQSVNRAKPLFREETGAFAARIAMAWIIVLPKIGSTNPV